MDYSLVEILDDLEESEEGGGVDAGDLAPFVPTASSSPPSEIQRLLQQPINNLDDVAAVFKASMTPAKLLAYAQDCSTPVWLDWMIKLCPKQVKFTGQMDVRAAFMNLGPPQKPKR